MKHTINITKKEYIQIVNDPQSWELRRYNIGFSINDTIRFNVIDKVNNEFIIPRMFLIINVLRTRLRSVNHNYCIISIAELNYSKNITM
jgi:DNA-directed RNA polymerase subunit E'/Rpb7